MLRKEKLDCMCERVKIKRGENSPEKVRKVAIGQRETRIYIQVLHDSWVKNSQNNVLSF